ncbi:hypothetical protein [Nonomuraea candida]|uniref:hypothetical protein n=1 Tax=Nonomuraea candida TaxID=359159 RepID=UPI0005B986AA|nr:hypothetical protein [Nonomuraea candida]
MSLEQHDEPLDPTAALQLKNVFFYECSSRRWNSVPGEKEVPPEETSHTLRVLHQTNGHRFLVRGRLTVKTPQGVLIADAVAVFEATPEKGAAQNSAAEAHPDLKLGEDAQTSFAENVGVPTLFPFLREAIHSGASRIGIRAPLLGILRAGSVRLSPADDA